MYDKDLPKPKVEVNITILDILDVDIKKSTFDIYYVQEVFWYDYDLEYSFLKDIDVKNILHHDKDRKKIWSPDIKYIHLEKSTLTPSCRELIFPILGVTKHIFGLGEDKLRHF